MGVVPLILACVGSCSIRGGSVAGSLALDSRPLAFALATLPRWWPGASSCCCKLPGLRLVPGTGPVHAAHQLGPGPAGRSGTGSVDSREGDSGGGWASPWE